ncbi:fibulin-2-like [Tropilaelaps mercedesae]|uniref:Fibulin-2-like n=1 Tax=Tropilaelaps mercedesae TaxID=418985 RepID=A0A1V9Y0F6_9ACAR|nr:fibulin-2-like [Tropilaelaps mercedesae]
MLRRSVADVSRLSAASLTHLSGSEVADIVRQLDGLKFDLGNKPLTNGKPKCKSGLEYERSSGYCIDVNECQRSTHNCSHVALCVNHAGTFECTHTNRKPLSCRPGYRFNWHLNECIETDECVKKPCPRAQLCVNEQNSFKCLDKHDRSCPLGYRYEQHKGCIDINECQDPDSHLCDLTKELCINSHGSYICVPPCQQGFQMVANLWDCTDIDECLEGMDTCAHNEECVNTWGGYNCEMPSDPKSTSTPLSIIPLQRTHQQQQQPHQQQTKATPRLPMT